jgi:hypothetical protein
MTGTYQGTQVPDQGSILGHPNHCPPIYVELAGHFAHLRHDKLSKVPGTSQDPSNQTADSTVHENQKDMNKFTTNLKRLKT